MSTHAATVVIIWDCGPVNVVRYSDAVLVENPGTAPPTAEVNGVMEFSRRLDTRLPEPTAPLPPVRLDHMLAIEVCENCVHWQPMLGGAEQANCDKHDIRTSRRERCPRDWQRKPPAAAR